ncbi:helix-turn-helix transcriptional regulator [Parafrankia elaeagni]|uniref:helix-turn-helix transcriptional regulator n=1 Tax=Parafrankia elaeagni TaxID=222534 RepID=UPI00054F99DC|nr:MarR family transcriptional regulator [Parafrankia elaeagni]
MSDEDPLIGYREMAERAGIKPGTLRSYRNKGLLPEPDDLSVPDRPRWKTSTVEAWLLGRPGRGTRTDLKSTSATD